MVELEYRDLCMNDKLVRSCGGEERQRRRTLRGTYGVRGCCAKFQPMKMEEVVFKSECHYHAFIY